MTKTEQAIKFLQEHEGCTPYRAAQLVGMDASVLYRALKRRKVERCPTCGKPWVKPVEPMEPD